MGDQKTRPGLSIIIPNYNGMELFPMFLSSVLKSMSVYAGKSELIVVDDNSTDDSVAYLEKIHDINLIVHETNQGFQKACNTGLQNARYEILFFLNNDVDLAPDVFNYFNTYFENEDTFAVTIHGIDYLSKTRLDGGKIGYWKKGHPRVTNNYYVKDHPGMKRPYLSFAVQGAYFFVDREKMNVLKGFDELLAPFIFEETELSYRALKRGWKIYYEPKCIAWHKHTSTLSKVASERNRRMLSYRNRIIFIWKNIEDPFFLLSHFSYLFFRLIFFPNRALWTAFNEALKKRPEIRIKRQIEKSEKKLTDRQIFNSFKSFYKEYDII